MIFIQKQKFLMLMCKYLMEWSDIMSVVEWSDIVSVVEWSDIVSVE